MRRRARDFMAQLAIGDFSEAWARDFLATREFYGDAGDLRL